MARCMSIAGIRFVARLLTTSFVSVGVAFYIKWAFHQYHPTGYKLYVLALLPALINIASLIVVGLYVHEEKDEVERSIILRSVLWGLGAALAVGTVWNSLAQYGLLLPAASHLASAVSYLSFWIVWAASGAVIRLRYR